MSMLRLTCVCYQTPRYHACKTPIDRATQERAATPEETAASGRCPACGAPGVVHGRNRRHVLRRYYEIQEENHNG